MIRSRARFLVVLCSTSFAVLTVVSANQAGNAGRTEVRQLLDQYERGLAPNVRLPDRRSFVLGLEAVANDWVAAAPAAIQQRRRELIALMALDLGSSGIIEAACDVIRRGPPSPFEHEWMLATAAVEQDLAQYGQTVMAVTHLEHALSRYPDDPRLRLALLTTRPELFTVSNRPGVDSGRLRRSEGHGSIVGVYKHANTAGRSPADLATLIDAPGVGIEARVRRGVLRFLTNHVAEAQADFEAGERSDDPFVRNLALIHNGLVLDHLQRTTDATDAYRRAVEALPAAKSSATAFAARLFLGGQREEAASVLERAYRSDPPAIDPWHSPIAERRFLPERVSRLREMAGRSAPAWSWAEIVPGPSMGPETFRALSPSDLPAAPGRPQEDGRTFRAMTSGVLVDAAVTLGKQPVNGLSSEDFEVLDDGVRQKVTSVAVDSVPLDVTMVIDTSSPGIGNGYPPAQAIFDAAKIIERLRPTDRIRVLTANISSYELVPMQPARPGSLEGRTMAIQGLWHLSWSSSIYDTLVAALIQPTPAGRRHLIMMFTDGIDGTSITTPPVLVGVAGRSDGVIYLSRNDTMEEINQRKRSGGTTESDRLLWPMDPTVVEQAALASGGAVAHLDQFGDSIVPEAEEILASFRRRYILNYQPTGVTARGWHVITVKVTKPGKYDVQARKGYWAG